MSFVPSLSAAVKFTGFNISCSLIAVIINKEVNEDNYKQTNKTIGKVIIATSAFLAGCMSLAMLGPGVAGYAAVGAFVGAGAFFLGTFYEGKNKFLCQWKNLSDKIENPLMTICTIVNLSGGIYSIIAFPFSPLNVASVGLNALIFVVHSNS
ncbi:MAG: hypothetical protein WC222_02285 [Parachlamydiales bacterium]|jgi:hypothetical protein